MKIKKSICVLVFSALTLFFSTAQETSVKNLYSYKLDNGLELYVAENHTVPLAYIEICIKGGGVAQTKKNAGLFHLYEHMMFKGNSKYANNEEMQMALNELGVTNWNGTTGTEYVNYFFTVPVTKLKDGLEFWSYAVRTPKMDKREFEIEKKVVLSEIEGQLNDPGMKLYNFMSDILFPQAPWTRSPGGDVKVVKKATIKQLKEIQNQYYIPNNAALFIGGDVNHEEVYKLVNEIYGSWVKGKDPWVNNKVQLSQEPLKTAQYYVMPFDQIAPQIAQVQITYRGPDAEFNPEDTYAPDLLFSLTEDPQSSFKQGLYTNPQLGIPDPNYTGIGYYTQRRHGTINFNAIILQPEMSGVQRVQEITKLVPQLLKQAIPTESKEDLAKIEVVKKRFYNDRIYSMETAEGLLSELRFWWASTSVDYYNSYFDSLSNLSVNDINSFYTKYIENKNPMVILLINPEVFKQCEQDFIQNGFKIIK